MFNQAEQRHRSKKADFHKNETNHPKRLVSAASSAIQTLTFKQKMLAGAIARGIAQGILHPVDVVRTRVQAVNVSGAWNLATFTRGLSPQLILA